MGKSEKLFTFTGRLRSLAQALRGVGIVLVSQHNAWIHLLATVVVVALGLWLRVAAWEWCALVAAITIVWTAEALNTALELLADAAVPEYQPLVGKAKDVAAGAVLISAVGAAVVGLVVFVPHVWRLIGSAT